MQALLQVGAEPTEATGKNATTALHGAMRLDRTEVVRTLITQGADPDQKTVAGVTSVDVSLTSETATVEGSASVAALIDAVEGAGKGASLKSRVQNAAR